MPSFASLATSLVVAAVTALAVSDTWTADQASSATCSHECSESGTTGGPWLDEPVREGQPATFVCKRHPCAQVDLVSPPEGSARLEATITSEAGGSYTVRVNGVGNQSMWTKDVRFPHGHSVTVLEAPFVGSEWMMEFTPRWGDGYGGNVTLGIRWLGEGQT